MFPFDTSASSPSFYVTAMLKFRARPPFRVIAPKFLPFIWEHIPFQHITLSARPDGMMPKETRYEWGLRFWNDVIACSRKFAGCPSRMKTTTAIVALTAFSFFAH